MDVEYQGQLIGCLLDTGCDRSVIAERYIGNVVNLQEPSFALVGAGKNNLRVTGEATIEILFDGVPMEAAVSISPDVNELLLGNDWLMKTGGTWDFSTDTLVIDGRSYSLWPKNEGVHCRRVAISEPSVISARHEVNIEVEYQGDDIRNRDLLGLWSLESYKTE